MLDELDLDDPIKLTGKEGTIVFMNSFLLHSATENFSDSNTREVMIMNYSKKDHKEFRKKQDVSKWPEECRKCLNQFLINLYLRKHLE